MEAHPIHSNTDSDVCSSPKIGASIGHPRHREAIKSNLLYQTQHQTFVRLEGKLGDVLTPKKTEEYLEDFEQYKLPPDSMTVQIKEVSCICI